MGAVEKHLVDEAEAILKKTRELRGHEVQQSQDIFLRWLYWSAICLGELNIPDERKQYFLTSYMESCREVQSSIVLALHGSYKNAIQILRNWLELIIAGIYYDHHQIEGQDWLKRGCYPSFRTFKSRLEREKVLSAETLQDIGKAWKKLSAYVHSLGYILEGTMARTTYGAVFPEYNHEYFNKWFYFLTETYNLCCILLVEHIPEVLRLKEVEEIFKPEELESLKNRINDNL